RTARARPRQARRPPRHPARGRGQVVRREGGPRQDEVSERRRRTRSATATSASQPSFFERADIEQPPDEIVSFGSGAFVAAASESGGPASVVFARSICCWIHCA